MDEGNQMSDPYTEMMDRDLASPQFVSWTVRREARHLLEVVSQLYPDSSMRLRALRLFELACDIDDEIERR